MTYFGGKIINPKEDRVILFYQEKPIDTFYLDNHNKFMGGLKNVKEGLYHFMHGIEHQYIYLEPKDSLLVRLNTWDFDESLVFAGRGADRNNMLIDCFLAYEKDKTFFYEAYAQEPKAFKDRVDSLVKTKLKTYQDFIEQFPNETDGYKEILKVALTYPAYARIERYPIAHAKSINENKFPRTYS